QSRHQAPHRGRDQLCGAGTACLVSPMRFRLDRGGQRSRRKRAMGEVADGSGDCAGSVGMTMSRTTPPFRADHVGSLLRPAAVKEARAKHAEGAISAAELKAVEDREIERLVKKQEEIGLQLATDGELRRSWWHFDFYTGLDGVELYETSHGIQFAGVATKSQSLRVVGKVGFSGHPHIDHFRFLKSKA